MSIARTHHRFSVDDYERITDLGILTENHNVELIRGQVLRKLRGFPAEPSRDGSATAIAPTHHRFSVDDYERMIDVGILTEYDRVELIRGEILEKMSIGELHAACVRRLTRVFASRLGELVTISVQNPVRLEKSEPEPDVTLLVPRDDDYVAAHPRPDDIVLVVEVGDSSIAFDRNVKGSIYAENGIAEYWIFNLFNRTLEVYRGPQSSGEFADIRLLSASETVDLIKLPNVTFTVAELFPPMGSP